MKNEKVILWKVKDYVRTIILFLINAFLIKIYGNEINVLQTVGLLFSAGILYI